MDVYWLRVFFDSSIDDVLSQNFVKGILLQSSGAGAKISLEAKALLKSWGNSWIDTLPAAFVVPPGPYFYKNNTLWQFLRLYDDYQGAFLVSVRPTNEDGKYGTHFLSSFLVAEVFCSITKIAKFQCSLSNGDPIVTQRSNAYRLQNRVLRAAETILFGVDGTS